MLLCLRQPGHRLRLKIVEILVHGLERLFSGLVDGEGESLQHGLLEICEEFVEGAVLVLEQLSQLLNVFQAVLFLRIDLRNLRNSAVLVVHRNVERNALRAQRLEAVLADADIGNLEVLVRRALQVLAPDRVDVGDVVALRL